MNWKSLEMPGKAYYSRNTRWQTSKWQTTSELAEQHHFLDSYGITRHFEGKRRQRRMEEDHLQCGHWSTKTEKDWRQDKIREQL